MQSTHQMQRVGGRGATFLIATLSIAALSGCDYQRNDAQAAEAPPPPTVSVVEVAEKTIPVDIVHTGTTAPIRSVELRAKVPGYLHERHFTEGAEVKKGELLFVIDPRTLKADVERMASEHEARTSELAAAQAEHEFARDEVKRHEPLAKRHFVARERLQSLNTKVREAAARARAAQAAAKAAKAAVERAQLDLGYTELYAPIDGRIGRTLVNVGNLVAADESVLATVVQLDPIYVYFRPSARELMAIKKYQASAALMVTITLPDGSTYEHDGELDFIDNTVDPSTGTIRMRAVFPNSEGMLLPGQFSEVRVRLTEAPKLLVPQKALGENQGSKFVLVVDKDDKVQTRNVTTGAQHGSMVVIEKGLERGERVITSGLQKIRAGMLVRTKSASSKPTSSKLASS